MEVQHSISYDSYTVYGCSAVGLCGHSIPMILLLEH